ncbi:sigma-54-dependent transcriptional regulator [Luteitalea pratensis]|nr:sigma-54 dependent transcriptional regulator [Luteitalea pratensis]
MALLERVIVEGDSAGEYEQVALAALSRFTLLTSHRSLAESQQALASAKRAVLRCGDAQLMAALHARVGQAYAQRSLPGVALAELHSALGLLQPEPNASIEAFTRLALSGAEYLLAQNKEAARSARSARQVAEDNGLNSLRFAAQANLSFLECRRGNFQRAKSIACETLAGVPAVSLSRGALLDTLANIAIALGDLEAAQQATAEIEAIVASFSELTFLLVDSAPARSTVARLTNRPQSAYDILSQAREAADARGDEINWAKLTLLRSEVACLLGDGDGADADTVSVVERVRYPSAETLAFLARARAIRAGHQRDHRRFQVEIARSVRVFLASGDRFHGRQTVAMVSLFGTDVLSGPVVSPRRHRLHFELAENLSFVCGLLPQPHLAGGEAVRLLKRMKVVGEADVRKLPSPGSESELVTLGTVGADTFALRVVPLLDATSRETVAHLMSVLRLAVAAVKAQSDSRRKVLSWDLDVAPEGRKGLYISTEMRRLHSTIRRVASSDCPVLILGETGTGKEVVAQEVHDLSGQARGPFVPFNVTAVPRDMLEGQLFGYRRGAFTGAVSDAKGLIRQAEGGTLFIDEIGELSLDLQPKLLRFLESGEIQPLGERPQKVNVRVIAATNARLAELVRDGQFRDDLFYRLNVVSLTIPPLRDRREEIPTLVNHFLTVHAKQAGKFIPQLTPRALERLSAYDWPGNVRQLTNELKRIVALSDEDELVDEAHLSPIVRSAAAASPPAATDGTSVHVKLDRTLQEMYDDLERAAIARAMEQSRHNQADTARLLGITRKGLYLKRRRLGLDEGHAS